MVASALLSAVGAVGVLVGSAGQADALSDDPVVPKMAICHPRSTCCPLDVVQSGQFCCLNSQGVVLTSSSSCAPGTTDVTDEKSQDCLMKGQLGPGYGSVAAHRGMYVEMGYEVADLADDGTSSFDDPAAAISNTHEIRLCWRDSTMLPTDPPECPPEWIVYRAGDTPLPPIGSLEPDQVSTVGAETKHAPDEHEFTIPGVMLDWKDPTQSTRGIFIVVNGVGMGGDDWPDAVLKSGACLNMTPLARAVPGSSEDWFEVFSRRDDTPTPFPIPDFDVCTDGTKIAPPEDKAGPAMVDFCITSQPGVYDQAEWVRQVLVQVDYASKARLQQKLTPGEIEGKDGWFYGFDNGVPRPRPVFLAPTVSGNPESGRRAIALLIGDIKETDPNEPLTATSTKRKLRTISTAVHEYAHSIDHAWLRENANYRALRGDLLFFHIQTGFENHLTMANLPGQDPAVPRISAGKVAPGSLGSVGRGGYFRLQAALLAPSTNLLAVDYQTGGSFWWYVFGQFAYPRTPYNTAHPGGDLDSMNMRPGIEATCAGCDLLSRPESDEGVDLFGLLERQLAATPGGVSTHDAVSSALDTHLGRSLREVVADFHTTLYLKDYNDGGLGYERWRLDWLGKWNSPTVLETEKPLKVPDDLYGLTAGQVDSYGDGLRRAVRTLDSEGTCGPVSPDSSFPANCTRYATPKTLPYPGEVESEEPVELSKWGTTALSVRIDPGQWTGWWGKMLWVQAKVAAGKPRFRLFTIENDGNGKRRPKAQFVGNENLLSKDANGQWELEAAASISQKTDEILLIVSGTEDKSAFTWRLSDVKADLDILDPLVTLPAFVGHPDNAKEGRKSFLVKLRYLDEQSQPIAVDKKSRIKVEILGCDTSQVPSCELAGDDEIDDPGDPSQKDDFTFMPMSGGNIFLVVTIPEALYGLSPGPGNEKLLGLRVTVDDVAAEEPDCLVVSEDERRETTMLVLDQSGSMKGDKLEALKTVAKALVQSMLPVPGEQPAHELGIVTFDANGHTIKDLGPDSGEPLGAADNSLVDNSATLNTLPYFFAAIEGITAFGNTSIGDGLFEAQANLAKKYDIPNECEGGPFCPSCTGTSCLVKRPHRQAMIVLSDGLNTADLYPDAYYVTGPGNVQGDNDPLGEQWPNDPNDAFPLLGWHERDDVGLPVPVVSTIALGQDADLVEMFQLAGATGGTMVALPGPEVSGLIPLMLELSDGMQEAFNSTSGHDRIFVDRTNGFAPDLMPHFDVEPGVFELRVNVLSARGEAQHLRLVSPSGASRPPTSSLPTGQAASFGVRDPEPGFWALVSDLPAPTVWEEPTVFIEATVRAVVTMFVTADVAKARTLPIGPGADPDFDTNRWVGSDILVRIAADEHGPMVGCGAGVVLAKLPTGEVLRKDAYDDGEHDDGAAGDGVYGAKFTYGGTSGAYDVWTRISCPSPTSGAWIERFKRTSVVLHDAPDGDGDGMPAHWEQRHGLDSSSASDALTDLDDDDLPNYAEFVFGTDPRLSDTDGGGESDRTEVLNGRDPRERDDDLASRPTLRLFTGNGLVALGVGMGLSGVGVEVEGWTKTGTPELIGTEADFEDVMLFDVGLPNGVQRCYRARTVLDDLVSGWSDVECTTPRSDPDPPKVDELDRTEDGGKKLVKLELGLSDAGDVYADETVGDRGVTASGVAQIRFDTTPSFEHTTWGSVKASLATSAPGNIALKWQPDQGRLTVSKKGPVFKNAPALRREVWVQVRDAAGNESLAVPFEVHLP